MFAAARLVMLLSLLTQLGGFAKTLLIAFLFGAGAELDGYYLALVVPSLLVGLIGGVLQAGFVPVYLDLLQKDEREHAQLLVMQLFTLLLLILAPICVLLSVFAGPFVEGLVLSPTEIVLTTTTTAFRVVIFVLLLNALADYLALVLNARKRFFLGSFSPFANIMVSMVVLAAWPEGGQKALTYGLLAGVGAQLLMLYAGAIQSGTRIRLCWPYMTTNLRRVITLASFIVLGALFSNFNMAVDQVMASLLGEGAVSIIGYGNRFHTLVVQILIMSMSTVLLPYLTELLLSARNTTIQALFRALVGLLVFCGIGVPLVIQTIGVPLLNLLLARGAMTPVDIESIASIWFWYSLGLLPMAWGIFLARYFLASTKPQIITWLAVFAFLANVTFNLLLIRPFGLSGLAISTSLVYLLTSWLFHRRFARETAFSFGGIGIRSALALSTTAAYLCWAQLHPTEHIEPSQIVIGTVLLAAAFFLLRVRTGLTILSNQHE